MLAGGCGVLCFAAAAVVAALTAGEAIDVSVAGLYVGETKIVEAQVTAAQRDNNVVQLRLGAAPHTLTVSLLQGLMSDFPPSAEKFYAGKTVRVVGPIRSFRGGLEITLHTAADIQVVEPGTASTRGDVAPVAAPVAAQPTIAVPAVPLPIIAPSDSKVRQLEERVHELEGSLHATPTVTAPSVDDAKIQQLEERLHQLEAATQARTPQAPEPDAAALKMRRIEERLHELEAGGVPPASSESARQSTRAPGDAPDDDLDLRLRKLEIRLRHVEQSDKSGKR
ncbi:MAG: hypothetical protein HY270_20640 [Deltaproteobacteria bacterium]|nr:hypothetical protein [Deltaproteobacteria bacterium]